MAQVSHREQLIDGAVRCLQRKGYARTTARDIASESRANLASIGYHFGSKEALLNEALIRIFVERNRYVGALSFRAEQASPLERLTTTFSVVREIFESFRPVLVAFVEAMAQAERSTELRAQMASHYREARREVGAMLRAGFGGSAVRLRSDPDVMASFLLATLDGLVFQFLLSPEDTPGGEDLVEGFAEWMTLALDQSTLRSTPRRRVAKPGKGKPRRRTGRGRAG